MDAGTVQTIDRAAGARADRSVERRRWLARNARAVARLLHAPPERWGDPGFRREVEDTRRGLMPIRSRTALVASFAREGSLLLRPLQPSAAAEGPVPVAYAIRWHELGSARHSGRRPDVPAA